MGPDSTSMVDSKAFARPRRAAAVALVNDGIPTFAALTSLDGLQFFAENHLKSWRISRSLEVVAFVNN